VLPPTLASNLVAALLAVPGIRAKSRRDELLTGLPARAVDGLDRADSARTDLLLLVQQLEQLGPLVSTGQRPLLVLSANAEPYLEDTEAGGRLAAAARELEAHYSTVAPVLAARPGGAVPLKTVQITVPEVVIFRDERVPFAFIERAVRAADAVGRLTVPQYTRGRPFGGQAYGTAWLITRSLLVTNHHVVAARFEGDPPLAPGDLSRQASETVVWLDYRTESSTYVEVGVAELVCADPDLDYAFLRLKRPLARRPLPLAPRGTTIAKGDRLNIIQHPQGGPLKYAIRGNRYVGTGGGGEGYILRYLTDTEPGSSGSPVFNDNWNVIGLHRAATPISPPQSHPEGVAYMNNEGVSIHAILDHIPSQVAQEIAGGDNA
jgi:endonuclease G